MAYCCTAWRGALARRWRGRLVRVYRVAGVAVSTEKLETKQRLLGGRVSPPHILRPDMRPGAVLTLTAFLSFQLRGGCLAPARCPQLSTCHPSPQRFRRESRRRK
ncbi:hypothetical protein P280DRAFT_467120 [Massarina eburnea CBS 473.64]|uniref:Uncharacterized protein n=1 Tax=Massarina eburnea CBS 473.64 TaxID=1395130 RepID=A0A6A6S9A8_9PLEO|nr:hypothetical protein P280DRAFT_467120 [Massarina eburnea CBS 473.64]